MWYALGIIVINRDCHQCANGTFCTFRWVLCDIVSGYSYLPIERRIRNGHETVFDVSAYVCIITQSSSVSLLMVLIKAVMTTVLTIYILHKYLHSTGIFKDLDCFTSHVGQHRTVRGPWKRQGIPCFCKIPTVQESLEKCLFYLTLATDVTLATAQHSSCLFEFVTIELSRHNWTHVSQSERLLVKPQRPCTDLCAESVVVRNRLLRI